MDGLRPEAFCVFCSGLWLMLATVTEAGVCLVAIRFDHCNHRSWRDCNRESWITTHSPGNWHFTTATPPFLTATRPRASPRRSARRRRNNLLPSSTTSFMTAFPLWLSLLAPFCVALVKLSDGQNWYELIRGASETNRETLPWMEYRPYTSCSIGFDGL